MADIHQRQKELCGWNQNVISNLTCLLLGVGGLGTNIASNLCRLGVKTIILVDMDIVEAHNLNRQILYKHSDVGLPKVERAKVQLESHCNVSNCVIEIYNFDAVKNWNMTIELVKQSDVVFNTIDHGDYFDIALSQISFKYAKPMVLGGTEPFYGHTVSYFLQGIRTNDKKYLDCHDIKEIDVCNKFTDFETFTDISFLPKDTHPIIGGSTVYSAGTCGNLMTCSIINYLMHLHDGTRPDPPKQMIFNLLSMESHAWFGSVDNN